MKVLGLASYPVEAAATRYRMQQFIEPLAKRNIELVTRPFISSQLFAGLYRRERIIGNTAGLLASAVRRLLDVAHSRNFDVLMVQREAMLFGPPLIEKMCMNLGGCPMLLDLDDATYVSYTSPTYGNLAAWLKWFSKTDDLIKRAAIVTCGNRSIAEYVEQKGAKARIIPTVVDLDVFKPIEKKGESAVPIIGWVGTHSTFPYLQSIFPVLTRLAKTRRFKMIVIGSGRDVIDLPGIEVEYLPWSLGREVGDFQSFDIGVYPIIPDKWAAGKSGFKAVQYMAVGIPFVGTPVGASAEIGIHGKTHFAATTEQEWFDALDILLASPEKRREMGEAGRRFAMSDFSVDAQADKLAEALDMAYQGNQRSTARP